MAERWYVLPGWQGSGARRSTVGVKYIDLDVWEGNPQIAGVGRRQWRFGLGDNRLVLIRATADPAQLDLLGQQPDVIELPDFATTIGNPGYNLLRNYLRSIGLPTDWLVRNVTTVGEAVDEIIELCTFARRFEIVTGRPLHAGYTTPDDFLDGQDVPDAATVAQSLGWPTPPPAVTIGELAEWGRQQGRIDPGKRRR